MKPKKLLGTKKHGSPEADFWGAELVLSYDTHDTYGTMTPFNRNPPDHNWAENTPLLNGHNN